MKYILSGLALAVFIGAAAYFSSPNQTNSPIRIGINFWPGYEYLFLAREKGFYAAEAIEVDLVETASLDDLRRAYERGTIDGMASSIIEVVQATANSGRVAQIALVPDFSDGADVILARDPIKSINDLKGKRVGMEIASLGQYIVTRALSVNGLTPEDIETVPLSQEQMVDAMASGAVDAVMTYPPVSVELLNQENVNQIFDSADIPGEVADVVSFDPEVIKGRRDDIVKFTRAWNRALEYALANPDDAHQISGERMGITKEEFADSLGGIKLLGLSDQGPLFRDGGQLETAVAFIKSILLSPDQQLNLPPDRTFLYPGAVIN